MHVVLSWLPTTGLASKLASAQDTQLAIASCGAVGRLDGWPWVDGHGWMANDGWPWMDGKGRACPPPPRPVKAPPACLPEGVGMPCRVDLGARGRAKEGLAACLPACLP